ncbi:MAG: nitroreductase family protein [Dehalococcoidales bacterium]|nr:nitroreductase family protein [Dehalococcoidales bacterium]
MEYMEVIRKRRSIRKFRDTPVPKETIDDILESARLAPSGGNGQNWLFGVITDKEKIEELSVLAGNQRWIASAPLVIAVCAELNWKISDTPEDDYGLKINQDRFTSEFVHYLREYDDQAAVSLLFENGTVMIPGEHICLTAVDHGLGACWIGNLEIKQTSECLNLPADYACSYLIPIGYPDMEPVDIERKNISEVTFHNTYGSDYY